MHTVDVAYQVIELVDQAPVIRVARLRLAEAMGVIGVHGYACLGEDSEHCRGKDASVQCWLG